MKYDIHNPTPAARVIYDGIITGTHQREYFIPAGETRSGVELAKDIAEELIRRTQGVGRQDADLRLTPHRELETAGTIPVRGGLKPTLGIKKSSS